MLQDLIKQQNWPSEFKSLSRAGLDWWACTSLRQQSSCSMMDVLVIAYKEAGDILVDKVSSKQAPPGILIYPILFLYRHYLELALKQIIMDCNIYLNKSKGCTIGHDLVKLWLKVKELIIEIYGDQYNKELTVIETQITELDDLDKKSDSFRYSTNSKGEPFNYQVDNINFKLVAEIIDGLQAFLFGISSQIRENTQMEE